MLLDLKAKYIEKGNEFLTIRKTNRQNVKSRLNITEQVFGRLTAIKFVRMNDHSDAVWLFKCICGSFVEKIASDVKNGHTRSCGCIKNKPYGESSFNQLYNGYRKSALRDNKEFFITKDEFKILTQQPCFYCGLPPSRSFLGVGARGAYLSSGIDRRNNSIGYIFSNCVPCCKQCNFSKLDQTETEFRDWIVRVYGYYIERMGNPNEP